MKIFRRISIFASLLLIPALAHAQTGCIDSPECSTAVLGLVGLAGLAGPAVYRRLRKR